jgi:hypothetical protein
VRGIPPPRAEHQAPLVRFLLCLQGRDTPGFTAAAHPFQSIHENASQRRTPQTLRHLLKAYSWRRAGFGCRKTVQKLPGPSLSGHHRKAPQLETRVFLTQCQEKYMLSIPPSHHKVLGDPSAARCFFTSILIPKSRWDIAEVRRRGVFHPSFPAWLGRPLSQRLLGPRRPSRASRPRS